MTDKHEVTVYDRVPATALVSVEMVHNHLERSGWSQYGSRRYAWFRPQGDELPICVNLPLERVILRIAIIENRLPSAVLADIAKEPA